MALRCAMPVNYTTMSSPSRMASSFIDLYQHMTIKLEEPTFGYEMEEIDMNVDCKDVVVKTEEDPNNDNSNMSHELTSWTKKHPQHWNRDEVLDWVYFVVEQMDLDGSRVCGEAYQPITGYKLCRMTRQEFEETDPFYGSKLYDVFRILLNDATIREPKSIDRSCSTTLESINQHQRFRRDHPTSNFSLSININNNNIINNTINNNRIGRKEDVHPAFQSNNTSSNLVIYDQGNDMKVDLDGLGVYSISTDIEFPPSRSIPAPPSSTIPGSSVAAATSSLSSSSSSSSPAHSSTKPSSLSSFPSVFYKQHQQQQQQKTHHFFNGQEQLHHIHTQQQHQAYHRLYQTQQQPPLPSPTLPQLSPILSTLPPLTQTYLDTLTQHKMSYCPSSTPSTFSSLLSSSPSSSTTSTPSSSSSTPSAYKNSNNKNNSNGSIPPSSSSSSPPSSSAAPSSSATPSSSALSSSPSSSSPDFKSSPKTCDTSMESNTSPSTTSSSFFSTPLSSTSSISSTIVEISSSDLMEVTDSECISDEDLFAPCSIPMTTDGVVIMSPAPSTSGIFERKKTGRKNKTGQGNKGNHLWEFVRDLLQDPNYNPRLLKWEDKENGVFRFVQSEAVAQLWGEKKKNPMMTYEKLSRAMRFCRTSGYFDNVPKNGKFPKKLCFMFGAKAHGWKN